MIYFDLEDPPDTSLYGTPAQNDNLGGPGCISPGCVPASSATTGPDGTATPTLTITDRYSGDNYRVRARLSAGGPLIAKTGIITAWKRIFVETDRMFREPGSDLSADAPEGSTTIPVRDSSSFLPGQEVWIFDADNQDPETNSVVDVQPSVLFLAFPTLRTYRQVASAYVGRPADGFFEADLSRISQTYDNPFVEIAPLPSGSGPVPWKDRTELDERRFLLAEFSTIWFKNGRTRRDFTNYIHLIGIDHFIDDSGIDTNGGGTIDNFNLSVIAHGRIIEVFGEPGARPVQRSTTSHEFGHQFLLPDEIMLNHPAWCAATGGPCPGILCLMERDRTRDNDIYEFEEPDLLSAPRSVRKVDDPQ